MTETFAEVHQRRLIEGGFAPADVRTKFCSGCRKTKARTAFEETTNGAKKKRTRKIRSRCKECMLAYYRAYHHRRYHAVQI